MGDRQGGSGRAALLLVMLVLFFLFAIGSVKGSPIIDEGSITNASNLTNATNTTLNVSNNQTDSSNITINKTIIKKINSTIINATANQTNATINITANSTANVSANITLNTTLNESNATNPPIINVTVNITRNQTNKTETPIIEDTPELLFNKTNPSQDLVRPLFENDTNPSSTMSGMGIVVKKTYIYGNGQMLASKSDDAPSKTFFYIQDHLGSNRLIVDGSLQAWDGTYYAFGEEKASASTKTTNTSYTFTGKEKDYESGLYYYGARYYNPNIGRFLQADALQGDLANPQTLNRYAYVQNNPLKYVDPTGNKRRTVGPEQEDEQETEEQKKAREEAAKFNAAMHKLLQYYFYDKPDILKAFKGWTFKISNLKTEGQGTFTPGGNSDPKTKTITFVPDMFKSGSKNMVETLSHELAHTAADIGLSNEQINAITTRIETEVGADLSDGTCDGYACKLNTDIVINKGYNLLWAGYSEEQKTLAAGHEYLAYMNGWAVSGDRMAPPAGYLDSQTKMFSDSVYTSPGYVQKHITSVLDSIAATR